MESSQYFSILVHSTNIPYNCLLGVLKEFTYYGHINTVTTARYMVAGGRMGTFLDLLEEKTKE